MFSIVIFVPATHGDAVREALATAGGGSVGNYDSCSFSCAGKGRFRPLAGANPAIGSINQVAVVDEERIETVVTGDIVSKVVRAVRKGLYDDASEFGNIVDIHAEYLAAHQSIVVTGLKSLSCSSSL